MAKVCGRNEPAARRVGGETSRGRNEPGAKRAGGETSRGRNASGAKRAGGETSRGRNERGRNTSGAKRAGAKHVQTPSRMRDCVMRYVYTRVRQSICVWPSSRNKRGRGWTDSHRRHGRLRSRGVHFNNNMRLTNEALSRLFLSSALYRQASSYTRVSPERFSLLPSNVCMHTELLRQRFSD